ncbi:MAG: PorP/SprF family type IX secretion system membrane protein [Flavipsychrobacter sp.]|nr:PorP/SprF family type IX secretion system membrane protein [Flavipsychrobacter sp.]
MNRRILKKIAALCALVIPAAASGQADVHFSQLYETSVLRNPGLVGVNEQDYKIGLVYRNQWSTISHPFQTAMLTAEGRFPVSHASSDFVSVALLGYYDKAGSVDRKISAFYPALNYSKCINPDRSTYLSLGFTGGYLQYSFDPTKATFNNQYQNGFNPGVIGETLPQPRLGVWDMGVGLNFNTIGGKNKDIMYIGGVSAYHITRPRNSFYNELDMNLAVRWNANLGFSKQASDEFVYQFHANYAQQGQFRELMVGGLLGWNAVVKGAINSVFTIYAGAFYRHKDAVVPVFKLRYKDLSFGFSYDVNTSQLKAASNMRGGYEIMLIKTGNFPNNDAATGKVMCPRF